MKLKLRDFSLKYKASITILVLSLIPLIVLGVSIAVIYSNAIEARSRMHIDENIRIMTSRISEVFVNANLCSNHILLNMNQIEDENLKQEITKDSKIQNLLNQSVLIFDGIESIVYVTSESKMYSTKGELLNVKKSEILNSTYMEQLENANGKTKLFDKTETCMNVNDAVVTMGKRVIHIITGETLGYVFINIPAEHLIQSTKNRISNYFIFDNQGNSIVDYEIENLVENNDGIKQFYADEEIDTYRYNEEKYLVARRTVPEYGWEVIGVTNLNKFNVNKNELAKIGMFVGCLITILMGCVIFGANTWITKPLLKLKKGAEEIANGNLDVQFNFHTADEIGKLGDIFNIMTLKIRDLLKRVDEEAKKKREYELSLIQEQIKPHFLYNTLDIIIVLIEMKREWEAIHVTKKLADYYKNSLSSSEEIISIETEVQIIRDYLELQNIRYGEKFRYKINVDEESKKEKLPRLTLQPLVENAIYHGLKYKEDWGCIWIEIKSVGKEVLIKVKDDGIGLTEEHLREIQKFDVKMDKHFGLYSVNHRLSLYYGENADFQIESKYTEGTCIMIRIPKEKKFD